MASWRSSAAVICAAGWTVDGDPFGSSTTIVSRVTFAGVVGRRRDILFIFLYIVIREVKVCVDGVRGQSVLMRPQKIPIDFDGSKIFVAHYIIHLKS